MGEAVRYFDGLLAPIDCVSVNQYEPCIQEKRCHFRCEFLQIRDNMARNTEMASPASGVFGSPQKSR
jgi:DNA-binding IscR family transcriptional regulator